MWESWGRYPKTQQSLDRVFWQHEAGNSFKQQPTLAVGLGRSYGDVCLHDQARVTCMSSMNRMIAFDRESGLLRCEAGISLYDLIQIALPCGWFLPVTPGTKFVTLGGAVANDIHGKNHHRSGTFAKHVTRFALLRSDGTVRECSANENAEWFEATVGGLGLTGIILWVELQLKSVEGVWINLERLRFRNLTEFLRLTRASDQDFEYTVAWIDAASKGRKLGRGLFMRGNHAVDKRPQAPFLSKAKINIPVLAPNLLLNRWSIKTFNQLYYRQQLRQSWQGRQNFDSFFYPLDAIGNWNRLYGERGFMQYQVVLPDLDGIAHILERFVSDHLYSFLSVLKEFGPQPQQGLLSFPKSGFTLTMDIPVSTNAFKVLNELDDYVLQHNGRLYPAKDARMSAQCFQTSYPRWTEMNKFLDPAINSSFWKRVTQEESSV